MKRFSLLVIILFLLLLGYGSYRLFSPSLWDGQSRLNLVIANGQIKISSLNPADNELIIIKIPARTYLKVNRGYGLYPIESIYNLGRLGKYPGETLLSGTLQENLGVALDGYLIIENSQTSFRGIITTALLGNRASTNLTKWDLFRLWWQTKNIRSTKIKEVDLGESGILSEIVLADESRGFQINEDKIAPLIAEYFEDSAVRKDNLSLAVLNGTDHPGLASKAEIIVSNFGSQVVEVGEWEEKITSCQLRTSKDKLETKTVEKLKSVFNCQLTGEDLGGHHAEVLLIIGEDYWEKLNGK